MRSLFSGTILLVVAQATASLGACSTDDQHAVGALGGTGGEAGFSDNGGGVPSDGGDSTAPGAGASAGGQPECGSPMTCAGLSEDSCRAADLGEAGGCRAKYGARWPVELDGKGTYAGCVTACCGSDCELPPDTFACAHPPDAPGECWTLTSAPAPDGWILLSDFEPCSEFSQCQQ